MKSLTQSQSAIVANLLQLDFDNQRGSKIEQQEIVTIARKLSNISVSDDLQTLADSLQQVIDSEYGYGEEMIDEWQQSHDGTTRIVLDSEGQRRVA